MDWGQRVKRFVIDLLIPHRNLFNKTKFFKSNEVVTIDKQIKDNIEAGKFKQKIKITMNQFS